MTTPQIHETGPFEPVVPPGSTPLDDADALRETDTEDERDPADETDADDEGGTLGGASALDDTEDDDEDDDALSGTGALTGTGALDESDDEDDEDDDVLGGTGTLADSDDDDDESDDEADDDALTGSDALAENDALGGATPGDDAVAENDAALAGTGSLTQTNAPGNAAAPSGTAALDTTSAATDPTARSAADDDDSDQTWREVQVMFVDDPRRSVEQAAELVDKAIEDLVAAARQQQESLQSAWQAGGTDTEDLRHAMQNYRTFWKTLREVSVA